MVDVPVAVGRWSASDPGGGRTAITGLGQQSVMIEVRWLAAVISASDSFEFSYYLLTASCCIHHPHPVPGITRDRACVARVCAARVTGVV